MDVERKEIEKLVLLFKQRYESVCEELTNTREPQKSVTHIKLMNIDKNELETRIDGLISALRIIKRIKSY